MSKKKGRKTDPDFYQKMLEAKRRKKLALEQKQLNDEFTVHPEWYAQHVVVKTEADIKLDAAFNELKAKLHKEQLDKQTPIEQAFNKLKEQAQGL